MKKGLVFLSMAVVGASIALSAALIFWVWHIDHTWTPIIEPRIRERQTVGSVRVLAKDGNGQQKWIGSLTAGRLEERQPLKLSEVPPQLVQAIVVLEDPRFLEHGGFDIFSILRAVVRDLVTLKFSQGGSTITQQLVKNTFLNSKKTLRRKFTELVLAALVEKRFTKDEILEAYMNEVYLGQLGSIEIHGVARAAEYYFGKKVEDLEIHEMALLAAMIASPHVYSPWKHPARTRARRDRVLRALAEAKLILPEELDAALKKELPGASTFVAPTRAAYLMDALRENLLKEKGELEILKGGFDLELALDLDLQEGVEHALLEKTTEWDPRIQGLVVAADPRTCEIKAYAGGINYQVTQLDRIRQSQRPIGSLMKPLELDHLLDQDPKLNLATELDDHPLKWSFDKNRKEWSPSNYDMQFRGTVTVREALEQSLNVPMVRIFYEREPSGLLNSILDPVRALGLEIPEDRALPSAILGAIDQSPWRVLQAYVKLVRQASGLADDAGDFRCKLSLEARPDKEEAAKVSENKYGQKGANLVLAALQGALRRGTSRALGAKLAPNQLWAGKTGTSSDLRDAWYAALSPELVMISWVGRDDNTVTKLTGATGAMPLVSRVIEKWSKRAVYSQGWSWPINPDLAWKAVRTDKHCKAPEIQQTLIHSARPDPSLDLLVPEPFNYEGKSYVYELMRTGAQPADCP